MSFSLKEYRYAAEEIQARGDYREAETGRCAGLAGSEHGDAIRQIGVSEVTFYLYGRLLDQDTICQIKY
jgi:hypothetical protein